MPPPGSFGMSPPGSYGYAPTGRAYGPTRRIGGLATAITALQAVSIVGTVLYLLLQIRLSGDASDFLDGTASESSFRDSATSLQSFAFFVSVVALATLVVSIIWSFRIAANLEQLGRGPLTWKPGLTIVVWLLGRCTLSIINFFMLREHWRRSDPQPALAGTSDAAPQRTESLITAWFVVEIAQICVSVASGVAAFSAGAFLRGNDHEALTDLAKSVSDRLGLAVAVAVLSATSTVLLLLVVRALTARHTRLTGEA